MVKEFKEKIITISMKKNFGKPATKKSKAALHLIKQAVRKETRAIEVKLSNGINEKIWERGMFKTVKKITVKVIPEGKNVRVYLPDEKIIVKKEETKKKGLKEKAEEAKAQLQDKTKTTEKKENKNEEKNVEEKAKQ